MGGVVENLTEALSRGAVIDWSDPGKPTLKAVPSNFAPQLRKDRAVVREVLLRAVLFREQAVAFIEEGRALPILALPEHQDSSGCLSCGAPVGQRRFRCPVCALAVNLALDGMIIRPVRGDSDQR